MEEYRNKVVNLHAILSQDYQQIGNISKTTSEFTSKSGSRRFLPREQQLFLGDVSRCFRVRSSGIRAADATMGTTMHRTRIEHTSTKATREMDNRTKAAE